MINKSFTYKQIMCINQGAKCNTINNWILYNGKDLKVQNDIHHINLGKFGRVRTNTNSLVTLNLKDKANVMDIKKTKIQSEDNTHNISVVLHCYFHYHSRKFLGYAYQEIIQIKHETSPRKFIQV